MPLPYAPPPKESKVYTDLKNLKVADVTSTQLISLKEGVYAQGVDGAEDEMRRLKLLGEVSNQQSSSGPISLHHVTETHSSAAETAIVPPDEGMYQLQALDAEVTNSGGTLKFDLYFGDASDATVCFWYYMTSTDAGIIFTADANWPQFPVYFSKDMWLTVKDYGTTYDSMTLNAIFAKVR